MIRWEYLLAQPSVNLKLMGQEGWELITVTNTTYFFKRPLLESLPSGTGTVQPDVIEEACACGNRKVCVCGGDPGV